MAASAKKQLLQRAQRLRCSRRFCLHPAAGVALAGSVVAASVVVLRVAASSAAAFGVPGAAGAAGQGRLRHQQLRRPLHTAGLSRWSSAAARTAAGDGAGAESKGAPEKSEGQAPAPAPTPTAGDEVEDKPENQDDGRALDTSSPSGSVGAVVVGLALLPWIALGLYSCWNLATSGQAVETVAVQASGQWKLAPSGLMGLAEGFGIFTVLGVLLWSVVSFVTRGGRGLPAGPLGLLGFAQNLAYVTALTGALAYFLNGLPADENPLRGLSFTSSKTELESAATKAKRLAEKGEKEAAKLAEKEREELATLSAGPRSQLDSALRTVQEGTSKQLEKAASGVSSNVANLQAKVGPNVKVLDLKVPDLKVPDLKVPDLKLPDIKLPTSAAPEPAKESKEKQPEVPAQPTPKAGTDKPEAAKSSSSSSSSTAAKGEAAPAPAKKVPDFNELFD